MEMELRMRSHWQPVLVLMIRLVLMISFIGLRELLAVRIPIVVVMLMRITSG